MNSTFQIISGIFVISGFISSFFIIYDLIVNKYNQSMKIMNIVWPLTGLWAGVVGVWWYLKFGRADANSMKMDMSMGKGMKMHVGEKMNMPMEGEMSKKINSGKLPFNKIAISALHCGAGCTLADIIGEWFTVFIPINIGGSLLAGQWTLDYILALFIGVMFQYAAIRPMGGSSSTAGYIIKAFKIDFWSLTSWQVGMYGFMGVLIFCFDVTLLKSSWGFWFIMQLAMMTGFFVAYPTNKLLLKLGIKKGM